jgi:predicted glycoside hydrolase/deacetylase ChbG (UPF0249 family)
MKKSMRFLLVVLFASFLGGVACGPSLEKTAEPVELIVRGDDMGMTHTCNLAVQKSFQEGILTCSSIIVPSPWFEEAAQMCREHPEWCIGVHMTLNSEWRGYRWKPVSPYSEVPSIVDEDGYFYPTTEAFLEASPELEDIDKELRAQMELAFKRGIDIQYIDGHMDTARATPEIREVLLKICQDYDLPLSRESEEQQMSIYEVPHKEKKKALAEKLKELESGLWLLVVHPGLDTPEERALVDINPEGLPDVALNRAAVTEALTSKTIQRIIEQRGIQLTDYRKLRKKE